jgi:hypothetical protein
VGGGVIIATVVLPTTMLEEPIETVVPDTVIGVPPAVTVWLEIVADCPSGAMVIIWPPIVAVTGGNAADEERCGEAEAEMVTAGIVVKLPPIEMMILGIVVARPGETVIICPGIVVEIPGATEMTWLGSVVMSAELPVEAGSGWIVTTCPGIVLEIPGATEITWLGSVVMIVEGVEAGWPPAWDEMEDNGAIPAVGLWAGRVIVEAGGGSFPNPPTLAMMDAKGVLLGLVLGWKLDFPGSVASGEEEAGLTGSVGGAM